VNGCVAERSLRQGGFLMVKDFSPLDFLQVLTNDRPQFQM